MTAAGGVNDVSSLFQRLTAGIRDDTSCPVCLEEFVEPKCLPSCAHNVCSPCLGRMIKPKSRRVECPECRVESTLPGSGVSSLPTNHLLVRLIERTPGRKERKAIKEALNKCKEKVESTEKSLKEMEAYCYEEVRKRGDELKCEISDTAENLVKMIRDQEKDLHSQVDRFLGEKYSENAFKEHERELIELMEKATTCIQNTEEVLQSGDVEQVLELKDVLVKQLEEFSGAAECRISEASKLTPGAELKYIRNENRNELCDGILGNLSVTGRGQSPGISTSGNPPNLTRAGQVLQTLGTEDVGNPSFSVFAAAVSRISGDIAVLDKKESSVYLFKEDGCYYRHFKMSLVDNDLWDIAFSKDDEVIVLDREHNQLVYYDKCAATFIRLREYNPVSMDVTFTSLSTDRTGRLIVVSSPIQEDVACVLVFSPDGMFQFSFGSELLRSPEVAVYHNEEFFVTDSEEHVMIFDNCGQYLRTYAHCCFSCPIGICIDEVNNIMFISNSDNSMFYVMKFSGELISEFQAHDVPVCFSLSKDGKKMIVVYGPESKEYFQIISYID